jgi:hypothetical protein
MRKAEMREGFRHGRRKVIGGATAAGIETGGEFEKPIETIELVEYSPLPVRWQDQVVHTAWHPKDKPCPIEETEAWKTYQRQLKEEGSTR